MLLSVRSMDFVVSKWLELQRKTQLNQEVTIPDAMLTCTGESPKTVVRPNELASPVVVIHS